LLKIYVKLMLISVPTCTVCRFS